MEAGSTVDRMALKNTQPRRVPARNWYALLNWCNIPSGPPGAALRNPRAIREGIMRRRYFVAGLVVLIITFVRPVLFSQADQPSQARRLTGLWRAKLHFGPEVKGALTIDKGSGSWTAEIAGLVVPVRLDGERISFELADGRGSFRGWLRRGRITGHWIQPRTVSNGTVYASPVTLEKMAAGRWRGTIDPLEDEMTFYLPIKLNADGTLGAFLRNPERNVGRFIGAGRLAFDGRVVRLLGRSSDSAPEAERAQGAYDAENDILSLYVPSCGGTFDFHRASASDEAGFYPRGKTPVAYAYRTPPAEDDAWPVAALEDVDISPAAIGRFIQMLMDMPIDSVHASDIHGVLIARRGKLVLEEYFHGFNRDERHDTRSAAKSLTSVLTGAAMLRGFPVGLETPAYETLLGTPRPGLDPRKKAIKVEHLLTMSSGLDCDDSDPSSAGNENTMQEQTSQPDWYRYTLDVKMVRAPGEKAVYGSANPNLLGGVLAKKTGRWLPDLFHDLVARPLGIRRYAMNLTPTGDAYMGGGIRLLPRDFMKFGQMILDDGRWKGRQVVSAEWAAKSISPLYEMRGIHYGFLWWVTDYPYKGRTVRAFFAGGNGGQMVMGIPELDLVIAFYGGNYSDPVMYVPQQVYVHKYILPAVN